LTIRIVRVLFPAPFAGDVRRWCLGISEQPPQVLPLYTSPVVWNFAMIGVAGGARQFMDEPRLAVALA